MIRAPPRSTRTDTRVPYTTLCRSCESRSCRLLPFTDHYGRVVGERIGRHGQVERGRASADAPGGVVVGAMAGAEPAAEVASVLARLLDQRQIGRASCRERVCQVCHSSVVAGSLKKKIRKLKDQY